MCCFVLSLSTVKYLALEYVSEKRIENVFCKKHGNLRKNIMHIEIRLFNFVHKFFLYQTVYLYDHFYR